QEFPDSRYTPDVLMRQAEFYFNPPLHQIEKAIEIYHSILAYTDSPKYNEALYKLGWSYYKLSDYPKAISYFTMLADDISMASQFDPKNKISNPALREESIEYIGISFLDYSGVEGAERYLNEIGGREYGVDVLKKIGDAYMDVKEEYDKAINAYEVLLKLYPYSAGAPLVQARIAEAYRFLEDDQQTYLMRKKLFADYHEGTDWWNNVTKKEARQKALQLSEHALRANVNLLLDTANETSNPNLYAQAVDDTKDYLKEFPEDSNAVLMHWNMALTLDSKLSRSDAAYDQYVEISNLYWGSRFQEEAAKNAIAIAQVLAESDSLQRVDILPLNIGEIREQVEQGDPNLLKNLELEPGQLSDGEKKLAAAIDNYIKLFPFEGETPARLNQAGSMYYNKNDFVNSLKYFKTLLKHFPEDSLAEDAEFLVMESYFGKLDFKSVEIVAKRMLVKDVRTDYTTKARQRLAEAIFLQAQSYADAEQHFKAAEEYSRVAKEVPNADFADLALFNAGLEYDRAKEYSRAVEIYDRLSQDYAQSEHYLPSLNNMALDYRELKDYRNAAIVFERLAEEDTASTKIETHLYNASVSFVDAED
ncbi:MAG: tetratricopeptide repeat protein, partial [bacterium]